MTRGEQLGAALDATTRAHIQLKRAARFLELAGFEDPELRDLAGRMLRLAQIARRAQIELAKAADVRRGERNRYPGGR